MQQRLQSDAVREEEKLAILLGLHYKFWHDPVPELARMLRAGGYPASAIRLTSKAVAGCKECGDWRRALANPSIKTTVFRHFQRQGPDGPVLHVGALLRHPGRRVHPVGPH